MNHYSLRRHSQMPECGYFSSYETGSHLLFPTFVLEIDTSIDNIISFKSLGSINTPKLDYAEPVVYPQPKACPATLIPPNNDTLDHLSVSFRIPTPKSGVAPPASQPITPSPPPPPEPPRPASPTSVITDEELISASSEPLSTNSYSPLSTLIQPIYHQSLHPTCLVLLNTEPHLIPSSCTVYLDAVALKIKII
jgi:hypothetical protein